MIKTLKKLIKFILGITALTASSISFAQLDKEQQWQQVYDARTAFYEQYIGALPADIMKSPSLFVVWPAGGFYVIPADKIAKGLWAYTSFGLSNADMPANMTATNVQLEYDDQGRVTSSSSTLENKNQQMTAPDTAGYGYEVLLITKENEEWPLWFLQWFANAELSNDAGILNRVEEYNGLTVEAIQVGENSEDQINVLITKAQQPLPTGIQLPNGKMEFLVAIVITDEEMQWSMEHGRDALLQKLMRSGIGQVSDRHRASVVK